MPANSNVPRTIRCMHKEAEPGIESSLRSLAVVVHDACEEYPDPREMRDHSVAALVSLPADLIEDLILAASNLLIGALPPLDHITSVWSERQIAEAVGRLEAHLSGRHA